MTDRFFTTDYKAAVVSSLSFLPSLLLPLNTDQYTKEGLAWIHKSDFRAMIARTVPELKKAVYTVDNAFKPWAIPRS
jgi:hypothetical protein